MGTMKTTQMGWLVLLCLVGCASGPQVAMDMAAKDFKCPVKDLTRHEIYPNKQEIAGCGKSAIYIKGCTKGSYGAGAECGWAKAPPRP